MPAVLRALQGGLESMYRVETDLDVCDFLVDGEARDDLHPERAPREQLLLKQEHDGDLQLGLFVDERTLENLAMRDPRRRLDDSNLQDFLLAVEGVSHFVYLVHRARQARPVSAVELELQAEVETALSEHPKVADVVVMHRVGLAIATGNARYEVKQEAHYVTHAVGGSGAVREVVELILKAQGCWDEILRKYEIPPSPGHRIGFGG